MKSPGSVLIVVLGLLAILAVVGLTFVTMSSIDRRTAANFAIQSQFMLAADGAVDYVCHHLIQDLWHYDPKTAQYHDLLLTDQNSDPGEQVPLARNEPFDYPSTMYDPWLATTPNGESIPATGHFSYGEKGDAHYGLTNWGLSNNAEDKDHRPNNLGWPTGRKVQPYTHGNGHGVWNPDLSFPFDVGLIRVSVTVLDHGGMVNLNAHGRSNASVGECRRYGYFVSDVDPAHFHFNIQNLLNGAGQPPGLWKQQANPYNDHLYAAIIENPGRYGDHPFTLDEEFELRRLIGTHFQSRLEQSAGNDLNSAPDTVTDTKARNRLSLTTVSWTSEVRPDFEDAGGPIAIESPVPQEASGAPGGGPALARPDWSPRKIDLNLDEPDEIRDALKYGYVFADTDDGRELRNQFVANIDAFRNGNIDPNENAVTTCTGAGGAVGAAPQPILSKIQVNRTPDKEEGDEVVSIRWTVQVQVISPWPDSVYGLSRGLRVSNITLTAIGKEGTGAINFDKEFPNTDRMPPNATAGAAWVYKAEFSTELDEHLTAKLDKIQLGGPALLDEIDGTLLATICANPPLASAMQETKHRMISRETEKRPPEAGGSEGIPVVYIGKWEDGGGDVSQFAFTAQPPGAIPIRFPRSVRSRLRAHMPEKGLCPYPRQQAGASLSFRAFARVGDLNQVLCPKPADLQAAQGDDNNHFFWPWVIRVAEASDDADPLAAEERLKFNWNDDALPTPGNYSRMNAANVFCVGGPWLDQIDNDGDGYCDEDGGVPAMLPPGQQFPSEGDKGLSPIQGAADEGGYGRFGGPELRVAGKVNLNTATEDTLKTLYRGAGLTGTGMSETDFVQAVTNRRRNGPIYSPVEVFRNQFNQNKQLSGLDATGPLEERDLPFTRISNIATLRSDTFSIYGTIEYGLIQGTPPNQTEFQVRRRRRFWALVDRSPCLAYYPGTLGREDEFIRPRILNFQWLD